MLLNHDAVVDLESRQSTGGSPSFSLQPLQSTAFARSDQPVPTLVNRLLLFSLLVWPILSLQSDETRAGDYTSGGTTATGHEAIISPPDSTPPAPDGPYVIWWDSSSAIVLDVCDDRLVRRDFTAVDTLRFTGACGDSTRTYVIPAAPPRVAAHRYTEVPRIFAVSDLHGEYEYFADLLQVAGVVDDELHWRWGTGHLVVNGDVFDRGDRVTECLWLIHRLEQEARLAGGRVHYTLGNHDVMIMRGDNRYVHERYLEGIARKSRIKHEELYGPETEMGRWLRSKHVAVVVNDILFTHAGINPDYVRVARTLGEMNELLRASLDVSSVRARLDEELRALFGSSGPLWYRGYFEAREGRYPAATAAEIDATLEFYGARTIVVGHSGVEHVSALHDGRIVAIDVPFETLEGLEGLLWEGDALFRVTTTGERVPLSSHEP